MDKKKRVWGKVNWQAVWRKLKFVFWVSVGTLGLMFLAALAAVMFNDWIKCQTTAFLCLGSRWEVVKFIILGVLGGVLVLFVVVAAYKQAAQIENNRMKKMKEILRKVEDIWRVVWEILVAGFLVFVGGFGLVLFILLITVIFDECIECWARIILDQMTKREAIELIGLGIAGILTFFGAIAVNSRAKAQTQIADAEARNNKLAEKGNVQERFKTAVEHLGHAQLTTRISSFYEFSHLARENKEWRESIVDILCTYLRHLTTDKKHSSKVRFIDNEEEIPKEKPSEEVQSLLDALFRPEGNRGEFIFAGLLPNLRKISLVGAKLRRANLQNVDMELADLRGADLRSANLQRARLTNARLQGAWLQSANLQGASLFFAALINAKLYDANLQGADLQGASLQNARLQNANLQGADLQGVTFLSAVLSGANLQDANLQSTDLQNVYLGGADLQGADLRNADLRNADLREVKNLNTAKLSGAKVGDAKRPKGFDWPDDVNHD